MAVIASVIQPDVDYEVVDSVPLPITNALPLPPVTWGWVTGAADYELLIEGIEFPYYIMSALQTEGTYLEPTLGQIWPRIG